MSFVVYDLVLLVLFVIFVSRFLYSRKKNLKKEGLLLLYKTSWGMKLIDRIGSKYTKTLRLLSYVSITLGYFLMAGVFYLFAKIVWLYILFPQVVRQIQIPPITPLIPYIDKLAPGLNLPPFFFIYWIVILAIIAITHEFAHGIFMRRYGIKIKSTGFGFFPFFLPVFLAAFVEQDEKSMLKASKFKQMAVLSAGTFANTLTAIFFFFIIWIFFSLAFAPVGITFDGYSYSSVGLAGIGVVNGISIDNPTYEKIVNLVDEEGINKIEANGKDYFITKKLLNKQRNVKEDILLYDDAPAIKAGLEGAISEINGVSITTIEDLGRELSKYSPGESIVIKTITEDSSEEFLVVLDASPRNPEAPWLGIGFLEQRSGGVMNKMYVAMSGFKAPHTFYESQIGDAGLFIYNLLWWLILISISVALVNMLPVGIFDGGRFFYLTIWGLTKNEKFARKTFSYMTYFFLFVVAVLMFFWVLAFFK